MGVSGPSLLIESTDSMIGDGSTSSELSAANVGTSTRRTVRGEYQRLFAPYRQQFCSPLAPPAKKRRKIVERPKSPKLWRHSFVFLQRKDTALLPDSRT